MPVLRRAFHPGQRQGRLRPQQQQADWRYRAFLTLASPLLTGATLWQAWQVGDSRLVRQRLGLGLPRRSDRPLWIHMASVGEVNAAAPLIDALRRRHPDLPIFVTTFTPTGAANAMHKFGPGIEHVYLPLDFHHAVRRFLQHTRPRCALILETEIWPRLFDRCRREDIPLLIVNGRLSSRTLDRPAWMRGILARALDNVDHVFARSPSDADGFRSLGVNTERISVTGNIKFAAAAGGNTTGDPGDDTLSAPITLPRPTVVAASTHDDEERQLARAWLASPLRDSYLLVIVPRHPKRKAAILDQLRPLGARLAVRSDGDPIDARTEIHLADTFGELPAFIAGAELVFIGGTLVPHGGQNVIEVARLGKVALFGPHMENFADERDLLLGAAAAIPAGDVEALMRELAGLLADPERRQAIGERARRLVEERGDVAERYVDALVPWIQMAADRRLHLQSAE